MRLDCNLDLIEQLVQSLYHAESQLILALPRVASRAQLPQLQNALMEHYQETRNHATRLEELASVLGIDCGGRRCFAMEGILKEGDEIMGFGGDEMLVDAAIVGACQAVEYYEISQYRQLAAILRQLDTPEAVELIKLTLNEEEQAKESLSAINATLPVREPQDAAK